MDYSNVSEAAVTNHNFLDISLTPSELPSFIKDSSTPQKDQVQNEDTASAVTSTTTEPTAPTPGLTQHSPPHPLMGKYVHPDGAMKANKYIHYHTQMEVDIQLAKLAKTHQCPICKHQLDGSREVKRRHIWDHYVVYSCSCTYFTDNHSSLSSHQNRNHRGERRTTIRICRLSYQKAREQLSTQLPKEFPTSVKPTKLQATARPFTMPQRARAPPPQPNTKVLGEHRPAHRNGDRISRKRPRSPTPERRESSTTNRISILQRQLQEHTERRERYNHKARLEETRIQAILKELINTSHR